VTSAMQIDDRDGAFRACNHTKTACLTTLSIRGVRREVAVHPNFDSLNKRKVGFVDVVNASHDEHVFGADVYTVSLSFTEAVVNDWHP
jgi:hypothetical protein